MRDYSETRLFRLPESLNRASEEALMKPDTAVQTVRRAKQRQTDGERLRGWQQACAEQGLCGEFAVSAKLGEAAFTEEQIKWIADMYGR